MDLRWTIDENLVIAQVRNGFSRKEKIGLLRTFVWRSLSILCFWNFPVFSGELAFCVTIKAAKRESVCKRIESLERVKITIIPKEKIGLLRTFPKWSLPILSFWNLLDFSGEFTFCVTLIWTSSCKFLLQKGKWSELNLWSLRSLLSLTQKKIWQDYFSQCFHFSPQSVHRIDH